MFLRETESKKSFAEFEDEELDEELVVAAVMGRFSRRTLKNGRNADPHSPLTSEGFFFFFNMDAGKVSKKDVKM